MKDSSLSIKGVGETLLVTVDSAPWEEVEAALLDAVKARREFFRGAQMALNVGDRALNRDEIRRLKDKLAEHDVTLRAVLGESAETIRSARRLELDTELIETPPASTEQSTELPPITVEETGIPGVLIRHTIRSGRTVRHNGHVVVLGDVNPGAQIVAGGDVLVWGRLRGTVHAGAGGDDKAMVCALDMRPMQLRIASFVAIAGDASQPRTHPEIAFVRGGQIVAEEWS